MKYIKLELTITATEEEKIDILKEILLSNYLGSYIYDENNIVGEIKRAKATIYPYSQSED